MKCFELYRAVREPGHPRAWQPTPIVNLMGILYKAWAEGFDEDTFHDALDEAMS